MAGWVRRTEYRVNIWLERKPKWHTLPWRATCGCGTKAELDTFERAIGWPSKHFREDHQGVRIIQRYRWDV